MTGFGIGGKVWLSECASAALASDLGCGSQLAGQTLLVTDESRAGSAQFIARAKAAAQSLVANPLSPCADRCVIVATLGGGYAFATAPIVFGGASSPPTASPTPTPAEVAAAVAAVTAYTTDLVHGQYEAAFEMLSAPDRARMGPLAVYSANEGQLFKSVAGQFKVVPFPTDMAPLSDWAATSGLTVDLRHAVLVEVTYPVIAERNAWDLYIVQPGATGLVLYDVR